MKIRLLAAVSLIAMTACSTHQRFIEDLNTPYYDASTPPQYDTAQNSGYLDFIMVGNKRLVVITQNRAVSEPTALPYIDKYGNHVFTIDASIITAEYDRKQNLNSSKLENAK